MIHILEIGNDPDGFEQFEEEVLKQIGTPFDTVEKEMVLLTSKRDVTTYSWKKFEIVNNWGVYSMKSIPEKTLTEITLKVTLENGKWLVNDKTTDNLSSLELRFLNMFFAEMKNLHHD